MDFLKIFLLSFVQGVTEFLPISSSGHLSLLEYFFKIEEPLIFIVTLHFGSLFAIFLYFFKDIKKIFFPFQKDLFFKILIASLPLVIIPFFDDFIEKTFSSIKFIIIGFSLTACLLLLTKFLKKSSKSIHQYSYLDAFLIGLSQLLSVFPGISRSGTTITTALFLKSQKEEAFKFSFLLSLISISGAVLLKLKNIITLANNHSFILPLLLSFILSFIFSYFSLMFLKRIVIKNKLYYFSFYLIGLIIFLVIFLK